MTTTNIRFLPSTSTPPVIPLDPDYGSVRSGVDVRGIGLQLTYTTGPETHLMVCAADPIGGKRASWLGWAVTEAPVAAASVMSTARAMGEQLLTRMADLELATGAAEELHRLYGVATDDGNASKEHRDHNRGIALGLAASLQILEVVLDRLGPGLAELAGQPARDRAAARPAMSFAEGLAATVAAIHDGIGDRAEVSVLVVDPAAV